ncbi:MAG TPA: FAD-dependent monooxygenase [Pseudonocardiaceae bacterium]|nr:FAD-dependent monooxygenase [Pseudonocardiaceae bacterium]
MRLPPGLNLGVQDAVNLGWNLAPHVRATPRAVRWNSYHPEHHSVATRVIAMARGKTELTSPPPEADNVLTLREIVTDLARLPDANRYLAA